MEPIQYLRALRRRWYVIVASVLVAATAAVATSQAVDSFLPEEQLDTYEATMTVAAVGMASLGTTSASTAPPVDLAIAPRAIKLPDVAVAAARNLDASIDPAALATQVTAAYDPEFFLLDISGYASEGKTAEAIAVAFKEALVEWMRKIRNDGLDERIANAKNLIRNLRATGARPLTVAPFLDEVQLAEAAKLQPISLVTFQPPVATLIPTAGFRPPQSRTTRALIAGVLGLLAGLVLALVLERFDTKIRTRQKAEENFELPVLSEIPVIPKHDREKVTVVSSPTGKAADAFRLLASSVMGGWTALHTSNGNGMGPNGRSTIPRTLLVTSAGPGDGKTTVAASLAAVYGELGKRVTVLSCDLRRPTIHRAFGLPVRPGLTELIVSGNGARPAPYETGVPNVRVLPSGAAPVSPGELLGSERMLMVLQEAQQDADIVILDCSPVLVASDVAPLLPHVDAVLLVARAGKTRIDLAERTADVLRRLQAPVVGVVLNGAREISMPTAYRNYYKPSDDAPRLRVDYATGEPTIIVPDAEPQRERQPAGRHRRRRRG